MEKKGSKICHCLKCDGASVGNATFYRHLKRHDEYKNKREIIPLYEFSEDKYLQEEFQKPLYNGATVSILDAVLKHFYVFAFNNGMTKSALSDELKIQKSILPQPNLLPKSYKEAKAFIKPLLIPLQKYEACVNDCVLFRDNERNSYSALDNCPKCDETRRKTFTYMPIGPRLARWFGTKNLCQLLYAGVVTQNGILSDFIDGEIYQQWYSDGNVFQNMEEELTVPLSLFADGLNPNRNISQAKSMWSLILTWIILPKEIRQLLGPMLLMGIIPSGKDGSEPKSLEPYFEVVVDELLDISEFPVYHAYLGAPVTVKVALLQYLCDIPAYSKVLHLSGHGALRSCPYCKDVGVYCKDLHKTIHLSNRKFLHVDNPLRTCPGFVGNKEERDGKPEAFTDTEEREIRQTYDSRPNKNQKNNLQKTTGMKGHYILMDLPYHKRMDQMQPDGMHTLADFVSTVMDLLIGKTDTKNVRSAEKSFGRFPETWIRDDELTPTATNDQSQQKGKSKKRKSTDDDEEITKVPPAPWTLPKECLREAERRAKSIIYPHCIDKTSKTPFTKPWTLRTMNSKLQFVTSGAFKWCIQGLLPHQQEETLFRLFDLYAKIITPELEIDNLPDLEEETHTVLSMMERDFPVTLQNLVSHLIHHIVDGFHRFGPLYGRWLFPYERANGWITRQCLKKGGEESTVMETYAIYDMCVYMILANKFNPELHQKNNSFLKASETISDFLTKKVDMNTQKCEAKEHPISEDASQYMKRYYKEVLMEDDPVFRSQGNSLESVHLLDIAGCRLIKYSCACNVAESKEKKDSSFVCLKDGRVGRIESIFEHRYGAVSHHWLIINMFAAVEKYGHFSCVESKYISKQLVYSQQISKPLVVSEVGEMMWILNM